MEESTPGVPADNRPFIIAVVVMIAFLFLGVLCIGGYAFFIAPGQSAARRAQAATVNAQNTQIALENLLASVTPDTPTPDETQVALEATETATAGESPTPVVAATETDTPEPITPEPTNTLVVETPSPTGPTPTASKSPTPPKLSGRTATPLGSGFGSTTPQPGATQLPATGFADEAGVPGLILLGFALIAVVIVARRLRLGLR